MLQHVNTVLVGKNCPASYTNADALSVGDVALFDENGAIISTNAGAAAAKSIKVGVAKSKISVTMPDGSVASKANIEFSNVISKDHEVKFVKGTYVAPSQDVINIDLSSATIKAGNRYVLRIVYKDLYEHPGQFTHTYEVIATDTTPATLASAFVAKISKHMNRRVVATVSSAVITLTAMAKDDNEGVNSINEYTVVNMEASMYETEPASALNFNAPAAIVGAVITKTPGTPGKGYWKQVRDAEVRNMGYKGHVFTGAYPEVEQEKMVDPTKTYDYITVEYYNNYLSSDNQYVKHAPFTLELFVEAGELASSIVENGIKSFIAGEDVAA